MHTDLMIDFETLDTRPTAAVTQLGWCLFNAKDRALGFNHGGYFIRPDTDKRTVSWDTVSWWLQQDDAARSKMQGGDHTLKTALAKLGFELHVTDCVKIERVWACGSDFDLPIYANCAAQVGFVVSWKFWQHRCLRTLYEVAGYAKADRCKPEIPHVAEYDALAQAKDVVAIYEKLGLK